MAMKTLDITEFKQTGEDLKREIANAVESTQSVLIQELPSEILMTAEQFKALSDDPDMLPMQGTTGKIWLTKHNVMEITVKE